MDDLEARKYEAFALITELLAFEFTPRREWEIFARLFRIVVNPVWPSELPRKGRNAKPDGSIDVWAIVDPMFSDKPPISADRSKGKPPLLH